MLRQTFLFASFLGVSSTSLACQSTEEPTRPAALGDSGASGGTLTTRQGGASGDPEPGVEGEASGVVEAYADDFFATTRPYTSPSTVLVASADGLSSEETQYDGAGFTASGDVEGTRWVLVRPISDSSIAPTLTQHELGTTDATIPVVSLTTLEGMFASFTTLTSYDDSRAQVVVRVIDSTGAGVSGISAVPGAAGGSVVAYKDGAAWQELDDRTNAEGLIFIPNVQTSAFPGEEVPIILTGSIDDELTVRIARGAVSVVTLVVP